jgi:hypothetical protein
VRLTGLALSPPDCAEERPDFADLERIVCLGATRSSPESGLTYPERRPCGRRGWDREATMSPPPRFPSILQDKVRKVGDDLASARRGVTQEETVE